MSYIKGTPDDPNFGYHDVTDYAKMLGEGQTANEYVTPTKTTKSTDTNHMDSLSGVSTPSLHPEYPPTHLYNDINTPEYPDFQYILDDESINYGKNGILPDECPRSNLQFDTNGIGIPGCGIGTIHPGNYEESMTHTIDPEDMVEARMDELTEPSISQNTSISGFEGHHTPVPGCGKANSQPHHLKSWHLIPEDF